MREAILRHIRKTPGKTVSWSDLADAVRGHDDYQRFAHAVKELESEGLFRPVNGCGKNRENPWLYNRYRVKRSMLNGKNPQDIASLQPLLHPGMNLQAFSDLTQQQWKSCLPLIHRINDYLLQYGYPGEDACASERSYQIMGDEKWIEQKGGFAMLDRLRILPALRIVNVPYPLMLAVNPGAFGNHVHYHLAVENKVVYKALQPVLSGSVFTSLIFGGGAQILANIQVLESQLGLPDHEHTIFYFGDLDPAGISLWFALNRRRTVVPAVPYYRAMLNHPWTAGNKRQEYDPEAAEAFCRFFSEKEAERIRALGKSRKYYPQETLAERELASIMLKSAWIGFVPRHSKE